MPEVLRLRGMEAKNADLSALRIDRAADPAAAAARPGARRWLAFGLAAAGVAVLAAVFLATTLAVIVTAPTGLLIASPHSTGPGG